MWPNAFHITYELFRDVWGFGELGNLVLELAHNARAATAWGALASAFLLLCTLLSVSKLARWLAPHAGIPLRISAAASVGMWLASVGFHALRSLSAFKLPYAALACLALCGLVTRLVPGGCAWRALRRDARALGALGRLALRSSQLPLSACCTAFALLLAARALIIPPLGWDTTTYHGPRAALWVSTGQFTFDPGVGCYDFYRHFFSGGEVLSAWAMLPFHSDLLANLASVAQWLCLFFASWALARAIGLCEPFASTSAGVVMFLPAVQLEVNSGYVELALNAALFQGIALSLHCLRRPSPKLALLCAMALGVAAAIKLPAIPPALIVASALALRLLASRQLSARSKLATAAIGVMAALAPAAPFMWQAYRDTGYPLSPMPVRAFGHTLGVASSAIAWYQDRAQLAPYTWPVEKQALLAVFSPLARFNESLGSLAVIPLLAFPMGLYALLRRKPIAALLLSCAASAPVLAHFGTELTAVRLLRAPSSTRFLIPFMALIIPVGLAWCRPESRLARGYRRLLWVYPALTTYMAFRRGMADWEAHELASLAIVAVVLVTLLGYLGQRLAWAAGALVWVLGLTALQARRDLTRPLAYDQSYALHGFPQYWARAVALVDEPEREHKLAITGGPDHSSDKWFHYFFLGRHFQNSIHYITPTRDGTIVSFQPKHELARRSSRESWLHNLEQHGITEVITFPPRSLEQNYMDGWPERFERLDANHEWGLYRVRPQLTAADSE